MTSSKKIGAVIHSDSENLFKMILIDTSDIKKYSIIKVIFSSQKFQNQNLENQSPQLKELDFSIREISQNNLNSLRFKGSILCQSDYFTHAKRVVLSQIVGDLEFGENSIERSQISVSGSDNENENPESIHSIGAFRLSDNQKRSTVKKAIFTTSVQGNGNEYFIGKTAIERVSQILKENQEHYSKNLGVIGEYFLSEQNWKRVKDSKNFFKSEELAGLLLANGNLRLIQEAMGQYITEFCFFNNILELCLCFADSGIKIIENGIQNIIEDKENFLGKKLLFQKISDHSQNLKINFGYDVKKMIFNPKISFDLGSENELVEISTKEIIETKLKQNFEVNELDLLGVSQNENEFLVPVKAMSMTQFLERIIKNSEKLLLSAYERKETIANWRQARENLSERLIADSQA